MKRFVLFSTLFFLLSNSITAQWIVSTPSTGSLYDIGFSSVNVGYACGTYGIYKTIDGGTSWTKVAFNDVGLDFSTFKTLKVFSDNKLIAFGKSVDDNSFAVKTEDGGLTWTIIETFPLIIIKTCYFIDNNIGFIAGYYPDSEIKIYKTTDGGDTWSVYNTSIIDQVNDMHFSDQNNGVIAIYQGYLKTTNGGISWTYFDTPSRAVFMFNGNNFYRTSDKNVYHTTDGGTSWIISKLKYLDNSNVIYFINADTGFCAGSNYCYRTIDAGTTWERQLISNEYDEITALTRSGNNIYATSEYKKIYKTSDFGGLILPDVFFNKLALMCQYKTIHFHNTSSTKYSFSWLVDNIPVGNTYHLDYIFNTFGNHKVKLIGTYNGFSDAVEYDVYVTSRLNLNNIELSYSDKGCLHSAQTITIKNSVSGAHYTLKIGNTIIGSPVNGNGANINLITTPLDSSTTYTIEAYQASDCDTILIKKDFLINAYEVPDNSLNVHPLNSYVCEDVKNVSIFLDSSENNVRYYLYYHDKKTNKIIKLDSLDGNGNTIWYNSAMPDKPSYFYIIGYNKNYFNCNSRFSPNISIIKEELLIDLRSNDSIYFINDTIYSSDTFINDINNISLISH